MKSQEVIFFKNKRNCSPPGHGARHAGHILNGGYITSLWNWISWRFSANSFCDFGKMTFAISPYFLLFDKSNHLIFQICFIRRAIAYLSQNIKFDVMDFSERRSEEMVFLLTLSVWIRLQWHKLFSYRNKNQKLWLYGKLLFFYKIMFFFFLQNI